ncbi:uncharacterized protein LOC132200452 [Neocloeon triangulifer]|uniref:uncharacterized protein LOC132200452 n=1 Tax=Neocloeon triangulifer TaxID=2078957 RepID=UPI00286F2970|nr:uncharacterized protein LOC132200452 [Neocloeon triangulifer]
MFPAALCIVFILLASPLGEAKTMEEWEALEKKSSQACLTEMNLVNELGANFTYDSVENFTKLEDFSPNVRCFIKCIEEKLVGQDMSNMKKFLDKGMDYWKDVFKAQKWSPAKVKAFIDSIMPCDALRGPNNCDTIVLMYLCEDKAMKKVEKLN